MSFKPEKQGEKGSLILQRGPVVLALDYTNYTPKAPAQTLRAYNLSILRKILNNPA
jgi:hypothetical protein